MSAACRSTKAGPPLVPGSQTELHHRQPDDAHLIAVQARPCAITLSKGQWTPAGRAVWVGYDNPVTPPVAS